MIDLRTLKHPTPEQRTITAVILGLGALVFAFFYLFCPNDGSPVSGPHNTVCLGSAVISVSVFFPLMMSFGSALTLPREWGTLYSILMPSLLIGGAMLNLLWAYLMAAFITPKPKLAKAAPIVVAQEALMETRKKQKN